MNAIRNHCCSFEKGAGIALAVLSATSFAVVAVAAIAFASMTALVPPAVIVATVVLGVVGVCSAVMAHKMLQKTNHADAKKRFENAFEDTSPITSPNRQNLARRIKDSVQAKLEMDRNYNWTEELNDFNACFNKLLSEDDFKRLEGIYLEGDGR